MLELNFLRAHRINLNLGKGQLQMGDQVVMITLGRNNRTNNTIASVGRVIVSTCTVIPPNSVVRLQCLLSEEMSEYKLNTKAKLKVLSSRSVCTSDVCPKVGLIRWYWDPGGSEILD